MMDHQTDSIVISVVIPCRGHARELKHCLAGLEKQTCSVPFEVIVADSTPDSAVAEVVETFPNARRVHGRTPLLPGAARNLGAQHARGRYLAFIDADCVPEPDWLAATLTALQAGAKIVGGAILDVYPFHPIAASDNLLQFADFPRQRPGSPAPYFPGCNLAISRTAWRELGDFPGDLPAGEDVLFTGRAAERWPDQVLFVPEMAVRHRGRTGLGAYWRHQETFGFYRGRLGLRLKPVYRRLGGHVLLFGFIIGKRLIYITFRTVQWNPAGLPRLIVLLPVLVVGLVAWTKGFQQGCLTTTREVV